MSGPTCNQVNETTWVVENEVFFPLGLIVQRGDQFHAFLGYNGKERAIGWTRSLDEASVEVTLVHQAERRLNEALVRGRLGWRIGK